MCYNKEHYGIYGIYVNDILVYIGKTNRNFEARFLEHKKLIESGGTAYRYNYLRKCLENGARVRGEYIHSFSCNEPMVDDYRLHKLEVEYIQKYNPKLNIQFTKKHKKKK